MQTYPPSPSELHAPNDAPIPPSPVHIYHLRRAGEWWRLTLLGVSQIFLLVQQMQQRNIVFALCWIAYILLMACILWVNSMVQLIVSPDGITYRVPGATLYAPWQEMTHIGPYRRWFSAGSVIVAPRVHWQGRRWTRWLTLFTPDGCIPITVYQQAYWQRGLGDEMRYYAPWLVETAPTVFE